MCNSRDCHTVVTDRDSATASCLFATPRSSCDCTIKALVFLYYQFFHLIVPQRRKLDIC